MATGLSITTRQRIITRLIQLTIASYAGFCTHIVYAGPNGENIVGGIGEVVRPSADLTQINQSSNRLAIDWHRFDVASGETVRFVQPNQSSIVLNRIFDNKASEVLGSLQANGQVFLVNPRGIVFGQNAVVQVGGLLATDLMLDPADFINGTINLNDVPGLQGSIQNQGLINAASGGSVLLLGHVVDNSGEIRAPDGKVVLASGNSAVISFDENSQLGVAVDQGVLNNLTGSDTAVKNSGKINAEGGQVLLSAKAGADVFTQAVNNTGVIEATSVRQRNGVIEIIADGDVTQQGTLNVSSGDANTAAGRVSVQAKNITNNGSIKADSQTGDGGHIELFADDTVMVNGDATISARSDQAKGGAVHIVGNRTGILDRTAIDVSGETGGGEVLVGGDFQGAAIDGDRTSARTVVGRDTEIKADAVTTGDGGKVIVWADDTTLFKGEIFARGGALNGDGGFVEVSGKNYLGFDGFVDTTAENGLMGDLLLDPDQITIVDGAGGSDDAQLGDSEILRADGGGANWTISETVVEAVASNLKLEANQSITINDLTDNVLNLTSTGTVTFSVRNTSGNAVFTMNTGDTINLSGGAAFNLEVVQTSGDFDEIQITTGNIIASNNVSIFTDNTLASGSLGESLDVTMNIGNITVAGNHNVAIKAFTKNIETGSSDDTGPITLNTGNIAISGNGDVTVSAIAQNDNTNSPDAGNIAVTTGNISVGGSGDVNVTGQFIFAAPIVQTTDPTIGLTLGNITIGAAGAGKGDITILADHANVPSTETITLNGTTYGTQGDGTDGDITIDGHNILLGANTTLSTRNGGGTGADITLTANTINAQNNDLTLNVGSGNFGVNFSNVSNLDALSLTTSRDIYLGDVAGGGGDQSFSQVNIDVLDNATSLTLKSDGNILVSDTNIASGAVILQADQDDNNAGTLTISSAKTLSKTTAGTLTLDGYNATINGAVTHSVSGAITVSPENLITMGANGSLASNGGNITFGAATVTMTDGATINSGAGTIAVTAANNATISGLTSTNATTSAVTVTSTAGSILDAGDTNTDITATNPSARVNLNGATGVGAFADPLSLNATAAQVSATSGDIAFSNTGAMTLNAITANAGGINISSSGNMTVSGAITATGASNGVSLSSSAGTFTANSAITAGAGGDITLASTLGNSTINTTVDTNGGLLTINAGDDLSFGALTNLQSDNGNIVLAANTDADTDGAITLNAASVVNAGTGTIALSAYEDIALTGLITTSASNSAVSVTSTNGVISDAGDTSTDISAINGRAVLNSQTTIGSGNALDLSVNQIDITSDAGGVLNIINNRALSVIQAISNGVGGAIDVIVNNDASLTIAGTVDSNTGAINLRADDDVNVNAAVAINSDNGNVTLRADNDSDVNGTGGAINLNATSSLNVGSGTIAIQADESIAVTGLTTTNATSSAVTITSTSRAINDAGATDISAVNGGVVLTAVTGIGSGNALEINAASLTATNTGANGIAVTDSDGLILNAINANAGDVAIVAIGLTLNGLVTGNTVNLNAGTGAISDGNGATNNIAASALTLTATTGIGSGDALEIDADSLTATNSGANGISVTDSDNLTLNNINAAAGDVAIVANDLDLNGVVTGATVSLNAGTGAMTDGNGAANNVVATTLTLSAATGIGAANGIEIDADNLTATNSGANGITITDSDDLALNNINANAGDIAITAVGLTLNTSTTGVQGATVNLNAGTGAIVDARASVGNDITATDLTLTATTGIGSGNALEIDADTLTVTNSGANGITVTDSDSLILNAINAVAGNIAIIANGLTLNGLLTGATVNINAGTGAISDGNAAANNIAATDLMLTATTGIGSGDAIEIDADTLTVSNSGANGITITDSDDLSLNDVNASAGNLAITVAGAITDGNAAANNITAANVVLTSKTGIGSADALETQIANLQVTNSGAGSSGNIRINNSGDLSLAAIDNNATTLGSAVFVSTTGNLSVTNNVITNLGTLSLLAGDDIAIGVAANLNSGDANVVITADTNSDTNGGIVMSDGAVINSRDGTLTMSAYESIALTGLISTNITNTAITVTSSNGAITDGGNTNTDITATAVGSRVNLNAATGIGTFANPLELDVLNLAATTTSGDLAFSNTGALTLDGVTTNNGAINISAGGDLTVASGGVTATGASNGVSLTSSGGNLATNGAVTAGTNGAILLAATAGNATINSTIDSNGGSLTVSVGDDIALGASANLQSDNGAINFTANAAPDNVDNNGGITFNTASIVNAGSGAITFNAYETISLTGLTTTGSATITSSNGAITDAGNTNTDMIANALTLTAATGIGSGNALEINAASLTATNSGANGITVTDVDNVALNLLDANTGAVIITSTVGALTDNNAGSNNIVAGALTLTATTGIGSGDAIEIDADSLTATNSGANGITVTDSDDLTLNNINAAAGDVAIVANDLDLNGVVTGATVSLNAGTGAMTDGNGAANNVVATNLTLSASTGIGVANGIEIDTDNLTATNSGANGITITDSDDLALNNINASAGDIAITAVGLTLNTSTSGVQGATVNLNAGTGAIVDARASVGNDITATDLTLTVTTGIGSGNAIEVDADTLTATNSGANGITVTDSDSLILNAINAVAGNIAIIANGLTLNGLLTGTTVNVNAGTGAISDGNAAANNIAATDLILTATTGIGSGDAIEIDADTITATNSGANGITVIDGDDLALNLLDANTGAVSITSTAGALTDNNAGSNNIVAGSLTLNTSTGIGSGDALEIDADTLTATNSGANGITVTDSDDLALNNIDAAAGNVAITANGLTINTSTNGVIGATINLNAGTGAITDARASAGNDITATDLILTAAAGIGSGNAIEIDADTLTATNSGANGITITDSDNLSLNNIDAAAGNIAIAGNGLTLNTSTNGVQGATVNLNAGAGAIIDARASTGNDITAIDLILTATTGIGDGNALEIDTNTLITTNTTNATQLIDSDDLIINSANAGSGILAITAANNIALTGVTTTNATNSAVTITSTTGSITDAGDSVADVTATAVGSQVTLNAATGMGNFANPLDLNVLNLVSNTTSGDLAFGNVGNITLNGITTNNGAINISAGGDLVVAAGGVTATGANNGVSLTSVGGNLVANGAVTSGANGVVILASTNGNNTINSTIDSNGGTLTIAAGDDLTFTANANVQSDNGNIIFTANTDADTNGGMIFSPAAVTNAGSGTIALTAYEDIVLSGIITSSATNDAVVVISTNGAINDAGNTATDISALNGRVVLNSQTSIGLGDALELSVAQLDATNDAGGVINIINDRALTLVQAISNGVGGAIDVVVGNNAAMTIAGNVDSNSGAINLQADDDLLINSVVAINSNGGAINLIADNDADASGSGGAINFAVGSSLQAGGGDVVASADELIQLATIISVDDLSLSSDLNRFTGIATVNTLTVNGDTEIAANLTTLVGGMSFSNLIFNNTATVTSAAQLQATSLQLANSGLAVLQSGSDADVTLGSIAGSGQSLQINSAAGITLGASNLGTGDISLTADSNNNQAAVITLTTLDAGDVVIQGSAVLDDQLIDTNNTINATSFIAQQLNVADLKSITSTGTLTVEANTINLSNNLSSGSVMSLTADNINLLDSVLLKTTYNSAGARMSLRGALNGNGKNLQLDAGNDVICCDQLTINNVDQLTVISSARAVFGWVSTLGNIEINASRQIYLNDNMFSAGNIALNANSDLDGSGTVGLLQGKTLTANGAIAVSPGSLQALLEAASCDLNEIPDVLKPIIPDPQPEVDNPLDAVGPQEFLSMLRVADSTSSRAPLVSYLNMGCNAEGGDAGSRKECQDESSMMDFLGTFLIDNQLPSR